MEKAVKTEPLDKGSVIKQRFGRALTMLGKAKLASSVLLLLVIGMLLSPEDFSGNNIFLQQSNLSNVLRQVSITGILAVGMTLVILTAGIDLSVGSVMAFGATACAMLLTVSPLSAMAGGGVLLSIALTLCVGLLLGSINGWIIARGGLQPFIATLAMMVSALGAARLMAGQDRSVYPIYTGSNAPQAFDLLRESVFGVPVPGLIFLAVVIIFGVLLSRFRLGRYIYAIGGNERAAFLSGIPVARIKILVYALSGMLATLAGVLYAAQYRQGKPDAGTGMELDAIAAVVIGGANLMGGKGTMAGTLVGVLIFGLLSNILQLNNVDSNTQLLLKGMIIVIAVLIQEGKLGLPARFKRRTPQ